MTASIPSAQIEKVHSQIPKDLLTLGELTPAQFKNLLDLSDTFKGERSTGNFLHKAPNTSLALIFEKPSTRTRVSFEVAMFELGGHAVILSPRDMQLSRGESIEDTARVLSGYCHAVAARVRSHETLVKLSHSASVPVINALSNLYHPCQTLADFQTIRECKGRLSGLKISWIGDGNNVCNSLAIGAALSGSGIFIACPRNHAPDGKAISIARKIADETGSQIEVTEDPREAASSADVVMTDTFVSMGQDSEKKDRLKEFLPEYQVNDALISLAKPDAIFLHCLPAHRGEEVTQSILDGPQSVVWMEAENRLHSQKAILFSLILENARLQRRGR